MIIQGDCIEVMAGMPENSVDAVVTDPPYGLEFMGKEWDRLQGSFGRIEGKDMTLPSITGSIRNIKCPDCGKWVYDHYPRNCLCGGTVRLKMRTMQDWHTQWATQALRVLKPGGYLLAFGGTRTYHRLVCGLDDAGFEIRDSVLWLYGQGFPKNLDIGKKLPEWAGWGTALKPAHEPICVARKPLSEKNVVLNVLRWGTGGIDIDGSRIAHQSEEDRNSATPQGRVIRKNFAPGQGLKGIETNRPDTSKGRWPANVILDEEAAAMLDEQSGEGKGTIRQPTGKMILDPSDGWNPNSMIDQTVRGFADSGGASRFFYCAKASSKERGEGNNHPTCKPIKLMEYLIKLVSREGATILDPFAGSGSTILAAEALGRKCIAIEQSEEYCEITSKRCRQICLV